MGKTKVYGKANNKGVPEVEIQLAKIIQNAKGRGLKWTRFTLFRDKNGKDQDNFSENTAAVCAAGATLLNRDTKHLEVCTGANDYGFKDKFSYNQNDVLNNQELLGLGYRLAMR